jgi:alpha-N-arabinofuranosidase
VGSIYAKGKGELMVGLRNADGQFVALESLGKVGKDWKKYAFTLRPQASCDGDFAIAVKNGTVQVDMATMTTQTGIDLGGFRPDILQAVKELHPTCLRWPGGGYVAQYDWKWGIGPQENRERWAHWMWMDYDQNCFGTDEFIRFCREVNSEPIIVVSVKFERPAEEYDQILQDAVNWLRYCNAPATDEWGAKRAANGHPEPYNVKYWEIDNEMWEMGIERYEKCVRDFSTAMRKIDPSIKIIACGGFREDEDFIKRSGNYFDYLSLHHYEQQGGYATGPVRLGQQYDRYAQMIAEGPNPNIKLFISEWNLNSIDWRTGLFAGGFLNMCEARDVVAMGAAALFIRRTDAPDWNNAFINFDHKDLFKAPNCQVTELWYDHFSKYRLAHSGETGNLSVSTTMSENGADVIVKVVNPTEEAATLRIKGDWTGVAKTVFEYYAPGSLTVANSMDNKQAVALKRLSPTTDGCDVILAVPALSAGVLTITVRSQQ